MKNKLVFKEWDVYSFSYPPKEEQGWDSRTHCFDGQLICKKDVSGKLYLEDTYWSSNSRMFEIDEVENQGTLTFIVNLKDVKNAPFDVYDYYEDKDIFDLSYHHNCYKDIKLRIGAKKSKEKMIKTIDERIRQSKHHIHSAISDLERYTKTKEQIENGNLEVYL